MENEKNTEEAKEALVVEETTIEVIEETFTKDLPSTKFFNQLDEQISRRITSADIILFAAAFATLPLVDFIAKAFGALGAATQILYAIVPAAAFGLGYWFSRNGVRAISTFLHSLAAIALVMATVSLLPMIPIISTYITGPGTIAVGMPILAVIFIFAAARVPNTGSSYIFATIATIIIFFLSVAQLLAIPCNNAIISGSTNAQSICTATPYVQNILIPAAIFALGYLAFKRNK